MAVKNTLAKMRVGSKHYEILVDLELALKLRKGEAVNIQNVLLANEVFYNHKTGEKASSADLMSAFGTSDIFEAADRIVKKGDIQLPQDYRDEQQETKKKQVIDWFVRNAVDARTGRPFTPQTISNAIDQVGANLTKAPIEEQVLTLSESLKTILPLKIETKKIAITIPAIYTGKIYGLLNQYKEKEDWLSDGSLKVTINIPVGVQMEFYDKLNAVTHGSALSEELKQPETEKK
ncbi:MAG: ribosome assembly factor SBDS [archaeon]|nr:ribosome assembly factor SBDS [archaeon]